MLKPFTRPWEDNIARYLGTFLDALRVDHREVSFRFPLDRAGKLPGCLDVFQNCPGRWPVYE